MPAKPASHRDYLKLRKAIERHNELYYTRHRPEIADDAYDALLKRLKSMERDHPDWADAASPTQVIGERPSETFVNRPHRVPMLSIDNVYSDEEALQFEARVQKTLGRTPDLSLEIKIDGVSISLLYEKGILVRALTRGDGRTGDEVTANVKKIKTIPESLKGKRDFPQAIEVRGEIYMTRKDFARLNEERDREGAPPFANPRNATAGSLKLLDAAEVARRNLKFMAHGVGFVGTHPWERQTDLLSAYEEAGIPIVSVHEHCSDMREALKRCAYWQTRKSQLEFDSDGMVIKVNSLKDQARLGYTAKSPRYVIAFKFPAQRALTRLKDIRVQVGRTGVLTPVADLEPVLLSGSQVSHATLHNEDEIRRLDLRVGDWVEIEKAGEIIPQVIRVLKDKRAAALKAFKMPRACPDCGSEAYREPDEVALRCPNLNCPSQLRARVLHFASRKAMDIEGLGDALVAQLVEQKIIQSLADIYKLDASTLERLERMGAKSAANLIDAIGRSKKAGLARLIHALGIRHVGEKSAHVLAATFGQMKALGEAGREDLERVHEVGAVMAESILQFFKSSQNRQLIDALERSGVVMRAEQDTLVSDALLGKSFVVTGALAGLSRDEAHELIRSHGGRVVDSVSKKTDYLVVGDEPGSKLAKAEKLGVKVINQGEWEKLLRRKK